ncbi:MAG TPA: MBL fold metallo-hydrolase, partial [Candidatus Nitrosotenuis sp.]|nr:MBL fold metallo-hydrolase [Candidatus Nitrosotenuis sp.]
MNIEYFGHSAVAVHEGRHTVLIDPFLEGNPHLQGKKPEVRATTILLTHGHEDHVGDAVEISKKTGAV